MRSDDLTERLGELFVQAAVLFFTRPEADLSSQDSFYQTVRFLASFEHVSQKGKHRFRALADGLGDGANLAILNGEDDIAAELTRLAEEIYSPESNSK